MPIDYDDMMQSGATGLAARYDEKDVMLYALGVGMGRDPLDEKELPFVYENNGLKVVPTFASVINRGEAPPERQRMPQKSGINFMMVVDGERRITVHKPLPPKCEVIADERYLDILDKGEGKGAVLIQERVVREAASNDKLFTIVSSIFARGDGGFGGKPHGGPELHAHPRTRARSGKGMRHPPRPGVSLCAVGRPQSAAPRSGFRQDGGLSPADPARSLFLWHRLPRHAVHRGRLSARAHQAVRCALLQAGVSGRDSGGGIWADGSAISFRASVKERPGTVVLNNGLCILS